MSSLEENTSFWLPFDSNELTQTTLELSDQRFHQAIRVWRLRVDETFTATDGAGKYRTYKVTEVNKGTAQAEAISELETRSLKTPQIILYAALIQSKNFELVLQKATELGASKIVPMTTARCSIKTKQLERKITRWTEIARAAACQSSRPFFPEVQTPLEFAAAVEEIPSEQFLICLSTTDKTLPDTAELLKQPSLSVMVGPEGGFTESEIESALDAGATPISVSDSILRAETAAIAAMSLLGYLKSTQ